MKKKVLEPFRIKSLELRNRIVALPVYPGYVDANGFPTERFINIYRRKAQGGAALVTVGVAFCADAFLVGNAAFRIGSDTSVPAMNMVAEAIHEGGAKAIVEITYREPQETHPPLDAFSTGDVERIIDVYAEAAARAKFSGFDAVGLHGAHGFTLHRFLSPYYNRRTDRYGRRLEFAEELLAKVRRAVGEDYPIFVWLTVDDGIGAEGLTVELSRREICPALEAAGADALVVTFGFVERSMDMQCEPIYYEPGGRVPIAAEIKKDLRIPVVGRGRINDPHLLVRVVEEGLVDLVGVGRALLADPDLPRKIAEGRYAEVNRCIACEYGCNRRLLYLRRNTLCSVNYFYSREEEEWRGLAPAARPRRVLVIGGGPAGVEAACVLAQRGHQVVLCEQETQLGGVTRLASLMPRLNLRDLSYCIADRVPKLARLGVDLRLGTAGTPALIRDLVPDAVVLAIGAEPKTLGVPGEELGHVFSLYDYLKGVVRLGERVVVIGGKEGAEAAVSLAREGRRVWLLEESDEVGDPVYSNPPRQQALKREMDALGSALTVLIRTRVERITPEAVAFSADGTARELAADTVVVALGRQRRQASPLRSWLRENGCPVYEIGDSVAPRAIHEAIEEANQVARLI